MKNSIITMVAILLTANAFAQSASLDRSSQQLKSLGSAFKSHSVITPKIDHNDITMGYAGQDVSSKPVIA